MTDHYTRFMFARWKEIDDETIARAQHDTALLERLHRWPIVRGDFRYPPLNCDCHLCHQEIP